jgi:hypothetical protein
MARSSTALTPRLRKLGKKQKWLPAFNSFISALRIQSKENASINDDRGGSELSLWQSQQMFLECLCEGLEDGVHEFFF